MSSGRWLALAAATVLLLVLGRPLAAQDSLVARARQLAASGEFRRAATTWREVLEQRPDDSAALAGLVDALDAAGEWRAAIAPLDRLLILGPDDPSRLRQRGLYAAWTGDRARAVDLLRRAVRLHPLDPACLAALAEVLSWSPDTREEARGAFAEALRRDWISTDLLVAYGDLLSWTPATRDSAEAIYRRVLSQAPGDPRPWVGLANLSAWRGKPGAALKGYDAVLANVPDHVGALRGRGGALNQLGRHTAAETVLRRALHLAPADPGVAGELARAELANGRFTAVRARLAGFPGGPNLRSTRDSALRATASAVEVSGLTRVRKGQLDATRLLTRVTVAFGPVRFHGEYEPSELGDDAGQIRTQVYGGGARLDRNRVAIALAGRVREVESLAPRQWDGRLHLGWRARDALAFEVAATRSAVDETRRALQGEVEASRLRGAVHADLVHLRVELDDLPGPLDASGTVLAGRYTGLGLDANERLGVDTRIGLVARRAQPWIRIGYGFVASRFGYNADPGLGGEASRRGGYFSPREYWLNQGILQVSHGFGSRVRWEADGRMGREWVRSLDGTAATDRTAATVHSRLTLRLASTLDLEARYLYVNAFDAFEMREFAMVLKAFLP